MAAYFNLNSNEILRELSVNKVNMILDKQGRIVLNEQSISSPHKETQRSPQFFSTSKYLATNSSQFKQSRPYQPEQSQVIILHSILVTTRQLLVLPYSAHQRSLTGKHF